MKILFYPLEGEAGLHAVVVLRYLGDGGKGRTRACQAAEDSGESE